MFNLPLLPRNLEACERDLKNPDRRVRLSVISDLTKNAPDAERSLRVDLLILALSDADHEVRRQTLVALADLSATRARSRVLGLLADPEIRVRQMAVMCLGEISERGDLEVEGRLTALLSAGDASIRYQALLAYSQLDPTGASDDVLKALSDSDVEVRELALRIVDEVILAAGLSMPQKMKDALVRSCTDRDPGVRLVAQVLLGELGIAAPREMILDVVAGRFRVREPRDEQSCIELAGTLGIAEAIPHLLRRGFGRWGMSFDPFRWTALASLCRLNNDRAFKKLNKALSSRSYMDRTMAVQSLGESQSPEATSLLLPLQGKSKVVDQEVLAAALLNLKLATQV